MWTQQQQQTYLRGLPSQHPQQQTLHPGIIGTDDRVHQHHHHHHHHRSTTMDLPVPSNPRASRNMAEKQRRDNLNTNISTMAALVPTVAGSSRRMDKISILRLAAAFLRAQYTLGRGSADFLPRQFSDFDLEEYFIDNLIGSGGFFIVVTTTGKIVYVSRQVEQHLGHAQNELVGQSLYDFVYPDDREELTRNLTPDEMQGGNVSSTTPQITEAANDNNSNSSEDSTSLGNERKPFREQRRSFRLRMSQRTVSRREHTQYECLHISGILRLADACKNSEAGTSRTRHREISSTSNDIVFVGMARLPKKRSITELSIIDANKGEYVTRHLVDGCIIYCDHRVSVIAGYLLEEVSGRNAFRFMHKDDFKWTMIGLRQMYVRAETCGSSCYRLLSKTGEFIYLRTHGYLEFDKETQTVESFVCINTLISEEEGIELIKEMKERFSATVSGASRAMIRNGEDMSYDMGSDSQLSNSKSSLEDASELEDAITHLISDLPSPAVSEDRLSLSPMPNSQFAKAAIFSQRMPPAAAQASKIGIKKIDHYLVLQGKGNRTPKQETKTDCKQERPSASPKLGNSEAVEPLNEIIARNRISEQGSPRSSGKPLAMHELTKQAYSVHDVSPTETITGQVNIIPMNESTLESRLTVSRDPGTSRLDVGQNKDVLGVHETMEQSVKDVSASSHGLRENNPCGVKIEHAIEILSQLEKQDPVIGYLEKSIPDNGVTSSNSGTSHPYTLKRICSDEDLRAGSNKKRHNDILYVSTNTDDEQQGASYCTSYAGDEEFPGLSVEFNQYGNVNTRSLKMTESPNSSLHDVGVDYQQLDPTMPLVMSNMDDEQFADLQDFKDDTLLRPDLDANPDLMMKIFDDLRPVMETFNEAKVQQLTVNNQAVSDEIRRRHIQLENSMAVRESQLNVLARDLENPALQAQREKITQLQAEHKMQKQILKTLQQDHHNMQVKVKHNIGV